MTTATGLGPAPSRSTMPSEVPYPVLVIQPSFSSPSVADQLRTLASRLAREKTDAGLGLPALRAVSFQGLDDTAWSVCVSEIKPPQGLLPQYPATSSGKRDWVVIQGAVSLLAFVATICL